MTVEFNVGGMGMWKDGNPKACADWSAEALIWALNANQETIVTKSLEVFAKLGSFHLTHELLIRLTQISYIGIVKQYRWDIWQNVLSICQQLLFNETMKIHNEWDNISFQLFFALNYVLLALPHAKIHKNIFIILNQLLKLDCNTINYIQSQTQTQTQQQQESQKQQQPQYRHASDSSKSNSKENNKDKDKDKENNNKDILENKETTPKNHRKQQSSNLSRKQSDSTTKDSHRHLSQKSIVNPQNNDDKNNSNNNNNNNKMDIKACVQDLRKILQMKATSVDVAITATIRKSLTRPELFEVI